MGLIKGGLYMYTYTTEWNHPELNFIVASRMYKNGAEREIRYRLETYGVRACGCNMKLAKGVPEEYLIDFFMAVYRRENYAEDYKTLREYIALRNQNLQHGDKSIHPIIDTHIQLFHEEGYSQNAIAEVTGVSQAAVNSRVKDIPQNCNKHGQVIEMLDDLRMFNLTKWIIDEDNERTGPYLTKEQRKSIQYYRDLGYTKVRIQRKTGFSPRAIDRWYNARAIE